MFRSKYTIFYVLACCCFCACAQTKNTMITNIYATYTVRMPGNIVVDEKGNSLSKIDTIITVYVDAKEEIKWKSAWRNGRSYSIITAPLSSPMDAGVQTDNEKLIIHANKGNKLWELRLIPEENNSLPPVAIDQNQILLQGEYNGKKITQVISRQIEIQAIPSV
jgi:hypothetical protein